MKKILSIAIILLVIAIAGCGPKETVTEPQKEVPPITGETVLGVEPEGKMQYCAGGYSTTEYEIYYTEEKAYLKMSTSTGGYSVQILTPETMYSYESRSSKGWMPTSITPPQYERYYQDMTAKIINKPTYNIKCEEVSLNEDMFKMTIEK